MKNRFTVRILPIILLLSILLVTAAFADRGSFVLRDRVGENISIYDVGQKAIIAWNNNEEIMILSTDKYVSKNTRVLEFLPLPSEPSRVEKVDIGCFQEIQKLIRAHRPRLESLSGGHMKSKGRNGGSGAEQAVQIVFHQKIGAHDITIAKTRDLEGFMGWVKKFLKENQLQYREEDVTELKPNVAGYLKDGYNYFVFDVIELTTEKKSIEPILYQFKSKNLYFPLRVTQLSRGVTNIALYLFTPFKTDIWGTRSGFVSGFYTRGRQVSYANPIKFQVSNSEMEKVSPDIGKFFGSCTEEIWFSTAKFHGETNELKKDFVMKPSHSGKTGGTAKK